MVIHDFILRFEIFYMKQHNMIGSDQIGYKSGILHRPCNTANTDRLSQPYMRHNITEYAIDCRIYGQLQSQQERICFDIQSNKWISRKTILSMYNIQYFYSRGG